MITFDKGKIIEYGLEDDVLRLSSEGYKCVRIAQECNKILADRKEDKMYIKVSATNIDSYLKSKKRELMKVEYTIEKLQENVSDTVIGMVENLANGLESEMDKLRRSDGPILEVHQAFYISLVKQQREVIKMMLDAKKNEPENVTNVAVLFGQHLENLMKKIENCKDIGDDVKSVFFKVLADGIPAELGDSKS